MKVLHIIPSLNRSFGGPARSVQGLVFAECKNGVDARICALDGTTPWLDGLPWISRTQLFEELENCEIVHVHGIWCWGEHTVVKYCRKRGIRYIISPRGMLDPWSLSHKWLKKRIARWLYQDIDLKHSAALHATAEIEAEQFRRLGFNNRIIISPNGVNTPQTFNYARHTPVERVGRRSLFVGRMHPQKGVMELVEAWGKLVASRVPLSTMGWRCELVYTVSGTIEREYEVKVRERVKELGLEDQFVFTGALNDDEKWQAYARADLFVLPTYSENFGIVVAEALWAGVPVITTRGTPWSELETYKCGWWIDIDVDTLESTLREALSCGDYILRQKGKRGHELIKNKYTWEAVVGKMLQGYRAIIRSVC